MLRSTALAISASLAGWLTWRLTRDRLLDAATRVIADGPAGIADLPFDVALTTICAAAMAACAGWLLLVTVAGALGAGILGHRCGFTGQVMVAAMRQWQSTSDPA